MVCLSLLVLFLCSIFCPGQPLCQCPGGCRTCDVRQHVVSLALFVLPATDAEWLPRVRLASLLPLHWLRVLCVSGSFSLKHFSDTWLQFSESFNNLFALFFCLILCSFGSWVHDGMEGSSPAAPPPHKAWSPLPSSPSPFSPHSPKVLVCVLVMFPQNSAFLTHPTPNMEGAT